MDNRFCLFVFLVKLKMFHLISLCQKFSFIEIIKSYFVKLMIFFIHEITPDLIEIESYTQKIFGYFKKRLKFWIIFILL
jgi:hypothetical protein